MADPDHWFWDPAAPYQVNHRLIFLGLHSRNEYYQWMDGTQLALSDWYKPHEDWEQPAVYPDTLVTDLLYLKDSQPTADAASLCSVMMLSSPFGSTHWAKIPCDYPVFRAGMICKRPGTRIQSEYSAYEVVL